MEKIVNIKSCIRICSFYATSMDGMQCNHPYWNGKGAYDNMIITHDNGSNGKIPPECPLIKEQLTIHYKLKK